jgi:hypothetical protein
MHRCVDLMIGLVGGPAGALYAGDYHAWKDYLLITLRLSARHELPRRLMPFLDDEHRPTADIAAAIGDVLIQASEAAGSGRADNVEKLISLHAKPDAKTRSGQTSLSAAINEGHADVQAVLERHLARPGDS